MNVQFSAVTRQRDYCLTCGAVVENRAKHEAWHNSFVVQAALQEPPSGDLYNLLPNTMLKCAVCARTLVYTGTSTQLSKIAYVPSSTCPYCAQGRPSEQPTLGLNHDVHIKCASCGRKLYGTVPPDEARIVTISPNACPNCGSKKG